MSSKNNETAPQTAGFKKEIGVFGGISIIGGIMIGSGIFYLGSYVLERTGMSMGLALLCWVIGGLVSILGGLCFAELGACDSRAGGMVVYMNRAYHPSVGYSFGFTSWVISGSGSIAALAIALPTALANFFHLSDMATKIIAIILIIALTAYNCFGIKLHTAERIYGGKMYTYCYYSVCRPDPRKGTSGSFSCSGRNRPYLWRNDRDDSLCYCGHSMGL